MRTTLAIDDDLMTAARAMAEQQRKTLGEVVSDLMRKGLRRSTSSFETRDGIPVLPKRGKRGAVTLELVNRLRDEEP